MKRNPLSHDINLQMVMLQIQLERREMVRDNRTWKPVVGDLQSL